jgi:ABC-2 type transport system ATP-binding protein
MYAIDAVGLRKRFKNTSKEDGPRRSKAEAQKKGTWTTAVDGVDLRVDEGDVVALLGPNGAGKTTTLMMLLGVTEPDEGSVTLLGHPLPAERTQALAQTNFTASYIGLPYKVRVREILDVFRTLYGAGKRRTDELVEAFGLGDFMNRYNSQLSSGQRTLVGLAKSLLSEPRLLVLDEPTASLDPEVSERVRHVIREERAKGDFTLLVTSHNMADIKRLCRRVVFIASGRVVADGSPTEIATQFGTTDMESTFLHIASHARNVNAGLAEGHTKEGVT